MTKAPTKTRAMDARKTTVARMRTGLNICRGLAQGQRGAAEVPVSIGLQTIFDIVEHESGRDRAAYPEKEAGPGEGDEDAGGVEDWGGLAW